MSKLQIVGDEIVTIDSNTVRRNVIKTKYYPRRRNNNTRPRIRYKRNNNTRPRIRFRRQRIKTVKLNIFYWNRIKN